MEDFLGYHSEWNLGSPGGWDYQRTTQIIGKKVWQLLNQKNGIDVDVDFDHPLLNPIYGFIEMLTEAHRALEGKTPGFIAVVAEEETLEDVVENSNLVARLNAIEGFSSALMAPYELELKAGRVCWHGHPVSIVFVDFNTNVLLDLHRKHNLAPLLQAVKEGRVINPRGTEPINGKSMFEVITNPEIRHRFHKETITRTPWTRQFFPRQTSGPGGGDIKDLVEWTQANWVNLVLKPERGYSGKGVYVGGLHADINRILKKALQKGSYSNYIVQEKIPLKLWAEIIPELDTKNQVVREVQHQTDFRCLFGQTGLFGFLCRYGSVPTNVGSGGGVQPLALLRSDISVSEATKRINNALLNMDYGDVLEAIELQRKLAFDHKFTYLLGPIKIALRPRVITHRQMQSLKAYCHGIWADCMTLEDMWVSDELGLIESIDHDELEIIRAQPWRGSPAIFASDGLFSFGAHLP